jgi:hypothetical protein
VVLCVTLRGSVPTLTSSQTHPRMKAREGGPQTRGRWWCAVFRQEVFYLISDRSRLRQDGGPQYLCERVGKEDWSALTQTVRANLVQMDKGFAAFEIARVLNKHFCAWAEH